jgi:elongation factor P
MIQSTQLRKGNIILLGDDLFRVVDFQHLTPGKGHGFMQTKLKNLRSGAIVDRRFRSDDTVEKAVLDKREMQYLYSEGDMHFFMDTETYEQIHFSSEVLGNSMQFLVANANIQVEFFQDEPVGIELPGTVDLKIVQTEPGLRSATVSNVLKPATTETGLVVQVPHFVSEGETVRVETQEGKYVERVRQ